MKKALLLSFILMGLLTYGIAQTVQISVFLNNGAEQTYLLSESDRLYFEDNTKLVIEEVATKSTVTIPLADIRKITCDEFVGTQETPDIDVAIFPNPVRNVLVLKNLTGKQAISIYALDGRLMKTLETSENQFIDISDLSSGLYFVKTQTQTLKMIKL